MLRHHTHHIIWQITGIKDSKSRNIVIAIELDRHEGFTEVSSIRSIYGRDNLAFFI